MEHLYTTSVSVCFDELRVNVSKNIGGQISYTPYTRVDSPRVFVSRSGEPGIEATIGVCSVSVCQLVWRNVKLQASWVWNVGLPCRIFKLGGKGEGTSDLASNPCFLFWS